MYGIMTMKFHCKKKEKILGVVTLYEIYIYIYKYTREARSPTIPHAKSMANYSAQRQFPHILTREIDILLIPLFNIRYAYSDKFNPEISRLFFIWVEK